MAKALHFLVHGLEGGVLLDGKRNLQLTEDGVLINLVFLGGHGDGDGFLVGDLQLQRVGQARANIAAF